MTTVSDADLLRLAEAATQGEWIATPDGPLWVKLEGDEYGRGWRANRANDAHYVAAAQPSRIKSLLSEKAELEREVERLMEALLGVLSAAEHAYHTASFPDPDGGDWWGRIKAARQALSPNNPAVQAMED